MKLAHWLQYPNGKNEGNINVANLILLDTEAFGKTKKRKCRVCDEAHRKFKEQKK